MWAKIISGVLGFLFPAILRFVGIIFAIKEYQDWKHNVPLKLWHAMGFGLVDPPAGPGAGAFILVSLIWAAIAVAVCTWFQKRRARPQVWDKFIFGLCGFILPNLLLIPGYGLANWRDDPLQNGLLKVWQVMGFGLVDPPYGRNFGLDGVPYDRNGAALFVSFIWAAIGVAICTWFQKRRARSHGRGRVCL